MAFIQLQPIKGSELALECRLGNLCCIGSAADLCDLHCSGR